MVHLHKLEEGKLVMGFQFELEALRPRSVYDLSLGSGPKAQKEEH